MNNPILLALPHKFETKRLFARIPGEGDGQLLHEAVVESLTQLRQFLSGLSWVRAEQSVASSENYCRNAMASFILRQDLIFLLFEKHSQQLVGSVGLHRPNWSAPKFDVGYWCRTSQNGRGYISEAAEAMVNYAFEFCHASRVEILTDEQNASSRAVAERCHFQLESIRRDDCRASDGSLRSTCVYVRFPILNKKL